MTKSTLSSLQVHFDAAFSAPDGIAKLRELILTLAMQGKLVSQDPRDQPASELLKEIEAEKKQLIKEGKIKKQKPLPPIKPEEIPYELPSSWEWVRLGEVGFWKSGATPSRQNKNYYIGDIPWVKSGEVKKGRIYETEEHITQEALDKYPINLNKSGSVLFAMYGANIGDVGIIEVDAATNQAVCACAPFNGCSNYYLEYLLLSLKKHFVSRSAGAAQPNFSKEKIIDSVAPLPPFDEQKRIVAKVDELMARCDELEKLKKQQEEKRLKTHKAAIYQLLDTTSSTTDNLTSAWGFLKQHFGDLYCVKENVTELRKAILQLAVMGKLVPQDPRDQPASELLKEIEAEKKQLIKDGKIKKQKSLPPIKPEEIPYELPSNWEWVRLGEVGLLSRGASKHRPRNDEKLFTEGLYPFVQTGDVAKSKNTKNQILSFNKSYNDFGLKQSKLWPKNTLCITIAANIAETGFLGFDACVPDSIITFVSINEVINKYVHRFIEVTKEKLEDFAPSTAQKNINHSILTKLLFPLSPLEEQKRIVAKVDTLMALCDELENRIEEATQKQSSLLNAVMAAV